MAAEIHYYGDKDAFVFTGTVHRDNLEAFADLLAEQILTPRFSDRGLQPTQAGRPRRHHQDPARKRRREPGQAGPGHAALPRPSLWLPDPRHGGGPRRDHARRRQALLPPALHARAADRRRRRRLPRGLPGRVRGPFRHPARHRRSPPAAAAAARRPRAAPAAGREAVARQCHLHRAPLGRHPRRRGLLSALRRRFVPGRAPHLQRRAHARACGRSAASTTATTPTSRTSSSTAIRPSR